MTTAATRVLIYRMGSLGDTLIALPALHLTARAFPRAQRLMLTNLPVNAKAPPAAAILDHTDLVHGYLRYAVGTRSPRELLLLWWRLFRWRPDVLVYLGPARGVKSARRDATFFRLCGVKRLVGVPVTEAMQVNHWEDTEQAFEPEAARLVRNLSALGVSDLDDPANWSLHLTDAEHAHAHSVLAVAGGRPVIAVSVGTKVQSKDWGRDNWQALLRELAATYPKHVLALGGAAEEREVSEFAAEGWRQESIGMVINLCGALTPRESAAVFARAALFVGHDSGPMHLAAAVQTPCVAIFAARNKPRVWFPYGRQHRVLYHRTECWGCGLETCIVERKRCLTSITVAEVMAEVRRILG